MARSAEVTIKISATVVSNRSITEHVFELYLQPDEELQYKPGQWVSIQIPVEGKRPAKRAYSMITPMRPDGVIHLIFDLVPDGLGSSYLSKLEPGERVEIINLMGNFILGDERPEAFIFFARYTGVVPVFALLKQLELEGYDGSILLVYSSPCEAEVFYREELSRLELKQLKIEPILLDQETAELPEAEWMDRCLNKPPAEKTQIYICGVGEVVKPLRKQVLDFEWPRTQMKAERFN